MKRRFKILIGVIAVLLILGYVFLIPSGAQRRKLEAYKQQLIAQGEKLDLAELVTTNRSEAGLAAGKAFLDLMNGYKPPKEHITMMWRIAPGVAALGHTNIEPSMMANYEINARTIAELRLILTNASLDFEPDYVRSPLIPASHASEFKTATQLITDSAMQELFKRNYSEAFSNLLAAADLVRVFNKNPSITSALMRFAMTQLAVVATWEALQANQWSDTQLFQMQMKWQDQKIFGCSEKSLELERARMLDSLAQARQTNDPGVLLDLDDTSTSNSESSGGNLLQPIAEKLKVWRARYRFWVWKASWSFDEERYTLENSGAAKIAAGEVAQSDKLISALNRLDQSTTKILSNHPGLKNHYLYSQGGVEGIYPKFLGKAAEAELAKRLLITAVALERCRLKNSAYPARLEDLVPDYLGSVPSDMIDGQNLRYKLNGDGTYLLYSIGLDGIDDGGNAEPRAIDSPYPMPVPLPKPTSELSTNAPPYGSGSITRGRDVVWPRAVPPEEMQKYLNRTPDSTNSPNGSR